MATTQKAASEDPPLRGRRGFRPIRLNLVQVVLEYLFSPISQITEINELCSTFSQLKETAPIVSCAGVSKSASSVSV